MIAIFCKSLSQLKASLFNSVTDISEASDPSKLLGQALVGDCMGNVRLVGGSNDLEDRVEVCIDNVWGTVCDDAWSSVDAQIMCGQLGYSKQGNM